MTVKQNIEKKLSDQLQPAHLEVIDESEKHHGHGGWREGGETHFRVAIQAEKLSSLSRIEAHRLVHSILEEELAGPVHAFALQIIKP